MTKELQIIEHDPSGAYRPKGGHTPERVRAKAITTGDKVAWDTNPFWEGFELSTRKKRTGLQTGEDQVLTSLKTGVHTNFTELSKIYEVDDEKFVKVFTRFLHIFFDVKKSTQKLFEVVLHEVGKKPNQDTVYLHPKMAQNYHERRGGSYSPASFYRSVSEMVEKGLIARSAEGPNLYWVNPAIFWNGDRVKFITEIKKAPQIMGPEQ